MGATNDNLLAAPQPRQNLHSLPIAVPDCNFLAFEYFLLKSHKNSKNALVFGQRSDRKTQSILPAVAQQPNFCKRARNESSAIFKFKCHRDIGGTLGSHSSTRD